MKKRKNNRIYLDEMDLSYHDLKLILIQETDMKFLCLYSIKENKCSSFEYLINKEKMKNFL